MQGEWSRVYPFHQMTNGLHNRTGIHTPINLQRCRRHTSRNRRTPTPSPSRPIKSTDPLPPISHTDIDAHEPFIVVILCVISSRTRQEVFTTASCKIQLAKGRQQKYLVQTEAENTLQRKCNKKTKSCSYGTLQKLRYSSKSTATTQKTTTEQRKG